MSNDKMREALEMLNAEEPEYHSQGMGCGLEDRCITDRYEAMSHGWDSAMERVYNEVINPVRDTLNDSLSQQPESAADAEIADLKRQLALAESHLESYREVLGDGKQPESDPGLVEALVTCQNWFERHSPTAPLINGAHAEHPMLEMIKSALSSRPARQPGLWVRNLSDPQPRAITDLKYRSVREVDNDVQFIPMFTSPQPSAQVEAEAVERFWEYLQDQGVVSKTAPSMVYDEYMLSLWDCDPADEVDSYGLWSPRVRQAIKEAFFAGREAGSAAQVPECLGGVKRFDVGADAFSGEMEESAIGSWVRFADVKAILAPSIAEKRELSKAHQDVIDERQRQVNAEGWTQEHDDEHISGDIAAAAGCYALFSDAYPNTGEPPPDWPWAPAWWKPKYYRRDLVRSASLVIAEIERLDRAGPSYEPPEVQS